ncbi:MULTISPECIES: transglycosylase SLT domain-containing protein [unclassified Streptomyces]|uniref:transglycosylase SLT domain-containing protein n=1 Tax=unclassified Streptomyces TaxID=2593676 RepID=UPI00035F2E21|nr:MULTISPECIES: transglycosylase SLT domain-containing protein [unclassified Streptomyces]MYT27341.1 transglycosylase SLT domain-containing protein [Streptomyces sp. SID8354]
MPSFTLPRAARITRITRTHKIAVAVLAAAGASTGLAVTAAPGNAATTAAHAPAAVKPVNADGMPAKAGAAAERPVKASVAEHIKVTAVAKQDRAAEQATSRSADRPAAPKTYANDLDGWIRQSLDIMKSKGIPGSYDGLHRNIMRESSGNPEAVNDWDVNAQNGIPSKGLLQVIQPTFDTYHVAGTAHDLTDPVANITAAANYAAHRYGSIDNVNSAY